MKFAHYTGTGYAIVFSLMILLSGCVDTTSQMRDYSRVKQGQTAEKATRPSPVVGTRDIPLRLLIPAIHVDTSIEQVGILANGDLDTPQLHPLTAAGWYNGGPLPGERGSAVIDGHLDGPGGRPAVFWNLHTLQVGNPVIVVMKSGKQIHFHVTQTTSYSPQNAPLQAIFGDTGGNYLNLITCAGSWIPSQQQTTLRMVVYTSLDSL